MYIAINNSSRFTADDFIPGQQYSCPQCLRPVIPVLGAINVHHWRHKADSSCQYGVGMTEWHYTMQKLFYTDYIERRYGDHIYDVMLPWGTAVEFQHSSITSGVIGSRNSQVPRIAWVFDVEQQYQRGQLFIDADNTFRYVRPKKLYSLCTPLLYWYCDGLIYHPGNIRGSYELNPKSGYNEMIWTGTVKPYTLKGFQLEITAIDNQYEITIPARGVQSSLFGSSFFIQD